ncbi:hypothetical protein [Limnoraphis robusta]|uniref:Transposase n=1 Tax=Limnoraphis robusta CCNP1315 TaxID=3110306 RepID=A0ABU5TX08_9CYAN|nr:hypothetical protein [Limnoraphis robusta]MEA5519444.1 hypothetical protein [Limnoraphis robusta CCNP1315]MEA5544226.1 hypothetical protein [Limnoraphis robusta CCNP1324]
MIRAAIPTVYTDNPTPESLFSLKSRRILFGYSNLDKQQASSNYK